MNSWFDDNIYAVYDDYSFWLPDGQKGYNSMAVESGFTWTDRNSTSTAYYVCEAYAPSGTGISGRAVNSGFLKISLYSHKIKKTCTSIIFMNRKPM